MRKRLFENRFSLLSFFLSVCLMTVFFIRLGVFPFGPRTLLMSDLDTIYADFLAELRRTLLGQGSMLYSFHAGSGLNFWGIFVFYLSSPFNFLLALFPEKYLLDGITLITILKVAFASFSFSYFLRRQSQPDRNTLWLTLFGLCYAFCGYAISYSFSIIWLDGLIILPLVCLGIELLICENRLAPLIAAYAVLFFSGFYIGYMAGLCSACYFLIRLISQNNTFSVRATLRKCGQFLLSVGIAAALNGCFIVPVAFLLRNAMGLFGQSSPAWNTLFPAFDMIVKLFPGVFDGYKDNMPHIYSGLLVWLALPMYFAHPSINRREKTGSALALSLFLLSFSFAPLNFIWHAFDHPVGLPIAIHLFFHSFCSGSHGGDGQYAGRISLLNGSLDCGVERWA